MTNCMLLGRSTSVLYVHKWGWFEAYKRRLAYSVAVQILAETSFFMLHLNVLSLTYKVKSRFTVCMHCYTYVFSHVTSLNIITITTHM